jgi:hypothetical protein
MKMGKWVGRGRGERGKGEWGEEGDCSMKFREIDAPVWLICLYYKYHQHMEAVVQSANYGYIYR